MSLSAALATQWRNPGNVLDLLLIVGGDVVQIALAQMTGDQWPTPVVFSFGWVAYAFTALGSAVGDNRLLLLADQPSILINGKSGYSRTNQSWVLGRILRNFENGHWMAEEVREELDRVLKPEGRLKAGICVSFFEATGGTMTEDKSALTKTGEPAMEPQRDKLWLAGYVVAVVQLGIAAIPCMKWGEWETLVITACGTILSFLTASLPHWRQERWACRTLTTNKTFILTRGNGAQHALVIFGKPGSLNLEDLASPTTSRNVPTTTKWLLAVLLALWVVLLVTVNGLQKHTWFITAIGAVGMLYSIIVAGASRSPENFGIPLEVHRPPSGQPEVIVASKVMLALFATEMAYPGVGRSMLNTFFPSKLSTEEQRFWDKAKMFEDEWHSRGAVEATEGSVKVNSTAINLTMELNASLKEGRMKNGSTDNKHNEIWVTTKPKPSGYGNA